MEIWIRLLYPSAVQARVFPGSFDLICGRLAYTQVNHTSSECYPDFLEVRARSCLTQRRIQAPRLTPLKTCISGGWVLRLALFVNTMVSLI